jgi:hypothetical protein
MVKKRGEERDLYDVVIFPHVKELFRVLGEGRFVFSEAE